jgi:hypothetical protein
MLNMQQVSAQDLQGLSWGLEVGDQLEYMWTHTTQYKNASIISIYSGNVTLNVTDLGPLSASHFSWMSDTSYADVAFTNGSSVPMTIGWTAVPIGNWTLMEELLIEHSQDSGLDRLDISLSDTAWKIESDHTREDTGHISNATREYSRLDGAVLNTYEYSEPYPYDDLVFVNELARIDPPTSPTPLPDSMFLIIAGAGIGIVVIAIVFVKLRRT